MKGCRKGKGNKRTAEQAKMRLALEDESEEASTDLSNCLESPCKKREVKAKEKEKGTPMKNVLEANISY